MRNPAILYVLCAEPDGPIPPPESQKALAASAEAITIKRRLAETRPDAFLPGLALSLETQGEVCAQAGRHADAAGAFCEGLVIIVPFAERNVQAFGGLAPSRLHHRLRRGWNRA